MTPTNRLRVLLIALGVTAIAGLVLWPEAEEYDWKLSRNYRPPDPVPSVAVAPPAIPVAAPAPRPDSITHLSLGAPPVPGWKLVEPVEVGSTSAPRDLGHGVLYPNLGWDSLPPFPYADTVRFRASPDSASALVGALVFVQETSGSLVAKAYWAPEPLTGNDVEVSMDDVGIPYDSVDSSGRWHRAILGFTAKKEPWLGWTALDDSVLTRLAWKEKFAETMLYFLDFDHGTFHSTPGGPVVTTARALAKGGFDVSGEEVQGSWLRVKVEHPGENCDGDLPANRRADHYWIKAFDDRGRPEVFFYTRGC